MEKSVKVLYSEYGRYISRFRALPYNIDCLRPVERRVLLSLYLLAKNNFVKSTNIIGNTMKYHPHGDASIYGTITKLVKLNLINGQGNWGHEGKEKIPPAAHRYTEVKLDKDILNLGFNFINYVPWSEIEFINEPLFIPSPIPIGLINNSEETGNVNFGMAFHRTNIPYYTINDLKKRLIFLLDKPKKQVIINPYVPGLKVISDKKESLRLLETGTGNISFIPDYESNKQGYVIYGIPIKISKLKSFAEKNKLELTDLSSKEIELQLTGRNIDEKKFIESITSDVTFNCVLVGDDPFSFVNVFSIDFLLLNNYKYFSETVLNYYNEELNKINNNISEYKYIKQIKKFLETKKINDIDKLIALFNKNEQEIIGKILTKYNISHLINVEINDEKLLKEKDETEYKIKNITDTVRNLAEQI